MPYNPLKELFQDLFKPSVNTKALKKCINVDREIATAGLTIQAAFETVGMKLQPNEASLSDLDSIYTDSEDIETNARGLSAILGFIITEEIGGRWIKQPHGNTQIIEIGPALLTVDWVQDILYPILNQSRKPSTIYHDIKERSEILA